MLISYTQYKLKSLKFEIRKKNNKSLKKKKPNLFSRQDAMLETGLGLGSWQLAFSNTLETGVLPLNFRAISTFMSVTVANLLAWLCFLRALYFSACCNTCVPSPRCWLAWLGPAHPSYLCDFPPPSFSYQRRQWHPTPVLLPGKSHGWRSLVGCSPWGR